MKTLILGCGYLGRRVAARWLAAGHDVSALTRSPTKAAELRAAGITPLLGDVTDPNSLAALPPADVALYAVAYDRASGQDRRTVALHGLQSTLHALADKTDRLVFISTTSVYAQSNGEWIDEDSPTQPQTEPAKLALAAERLLSPTSSLLRTRSAILRLSGLYGSGRLLRRIEQLRARDPIPGDPDAWLNLIHVEDAATAVLHAAERLTQARPPSPWGEGPGVRGALAASPVYLISDDLPIPRRDYYGRLAELTNSPPPLFDPTIETRTTGLGKRCRNDHAKRELGLTLAFPTFEQGLPEALIHGRKQSS